MPVIGFSYLRTFPSAPAVPLLQFAVLGLTGIQFLSQQSATSTSNVGGIFQTGF